LVYPAEVRVLGAVRLSKMRDESTSPERQRAQVEAWSQLHGHAVATITEDTDVSGKVPATLRPGLGPWLTNPALSSQWDVLVAAKMDRITRSVADLCDLIEFCDKHGKILVSVSESFDLSTPAGRMVAHILASVAQFERERIGERRAEAAMALQKAARWQGGRFPFGYRPERNGNGWLLVPDPDTAPVVAWMAERIVRGQSATSLARDLEERGIRTPRGGKGWSAEVVIGVLRNPALTGHVHWRGEMIRDDDGMAVRREPVLDDAVWAHVQVALDQNSQMRSGHRRDASLLLRVAFCGRCGRPLYRHLRVLRNRRYDHYACAARLASGGRRCQEPYFRAEVLEHVIEAVLLSSAGDVPMMIRRVTPAQDRSADIAAKEEALAHLQERIISAREPGLIGFFEETARKLLADLETLRAEPARPETVSWEATGQTFGEYWAALPETGRHEFLLRSAVRVYADHNTEDPWPRPGTDGMVVLAVHSGIRVNIELGDLKALRDMAGETSNARNQPLKASTT
jgi:site-specific DNA recombinase